MNRKPLTSLAILLAASTALAQTNGGIGKGLDQLDEKQVMAELATSNLTTLLNRDFKNFNIPPGEQDQEMTYLLLKQLQNPVGLNIAGRRALAVRAAKGLDALMPRITDPAALMEQANELFSYGIVPNVTQLEYFGENPATQAQLKPMAETAKRMYARVGDLADVKLNALKNQITQANMNQLLPQIQKLRETKFFGNYSDNMATYALCISLPKSDPKRKTLADNTIKYLSQFDNDKSGVQPTIRMQTGKLQLVAGNFKDAKETFDTVSDLKAITPTPDTGQQNDARYFAIVAQISLLDFKHAESNIPQLESWEAQTYLPKLSPGEQAEVKAALSMLKFRLYSGQSDLTNDVDEKKKTNDQAIGVLAQLISDQPNLKDLVYDQLIGRIPDQADLTTLNPLILQALEQQGIDEVIKKPDEPTDQKKLTRAIEAAKQIVSRQGQPGVDETVAMRSAYFIAYAYERLHQDKQAAGAFMDFAGKFPKETAKAEDAIDHATALIGQLRKQDKTDPDTRNLYDRFLPLAINPPFNRKVFAYSYAALLQEEHQFAKSAEYFKQVPDSDKRYPQSQYLEMLALTQELGDSSLKGDDRKAVVTQILDLIKTIDNLPAGAKTDEDKKTYVEWVLNADEIAADLTRRELKDPAQSLKILDGFEQRIASAPDADKAHIQALQLRIGDYMDMGNVDEATKALVSLMSANEDQGKDLMFTVLKTVDSDMDTARATGNTSDLKRLAQDRAQLSGFVVDWASKSKDPRQKAALANYQGYDAESKRVAAELIDDPTAKKAGLEAALKEYQDLNRKNPDDPATQLGLGLTSYSLGRFQDAVDFLAPLMDNAKVLRPTKTVTAPGGVEQEVEDPQFWEANYKRLRSLVELYKQNPHDPKAQQSLQLAHSYIGSLYIINGKKTGGKVYGDEFNQLRDEVAGLVKK